MATRGQVGGISRAAFDATILLDASGYDYIITETIGAGQGDIAISRCSHVVILVTAPNLGDEIQALKAGLMEIADLYVVNKSDIQGAPVAAEKLRQGVSPRPSGWKPMVLRTVATKRQGVEELFSAVKQHKRFILESTLPQNPTFFATEELKQASTNLIEASLSNRAADEKLANLAAEVARRKIDPYSAAAKLIPALRRS
jgi:LAO/AO transport system kinase